MIKLVVTGANGQLGSAIKRISSIYKDFQFFFTDIPELDLSDQTKTKQFIKHINPSYIINCAAYTAVDKAEDDKENAYMINADVVNTLGEISRLEGIKLIHISTDYVFSGNCCKPYKENDIPDPESVYGLSKLKGEKYLKDIENAIIIRTSWLYSSSGESFVGKILSRSSQGKTLKVVFDQVGCPTFVMDLAKAILEIIRKTEEKEVEFRPGVYHYSNEGIASWYDFAVEILKFYGSDCPIVPVESSEFPTRARRPHYSVFSKQKIKVTYNLVIPHWRDSLEICIKELRRDV